MLRPIKDFTGFKLETLDGEIGAVDEFYFDDLDWTIRYLVLKIHRWLPGKSVLISPEALGLPDWENKTIPVALTKSQIEQSPDVEFHTKPLTRESHEKLMNYYGWSDYWRADTRLQSSKDLMGFKIEAKNGDIGKVDTFIVDDTTWRLRYLIVDTHEWLPGKKVAIALDWINRIDPDNDRVHVDLLREQIEDAPEYNADTGVLREYEVDLYGYYQKPGYWESEIGRGSRQKTHRGMVAKRGRTKKKQRRR